jgi:hypothetical protein
MDRRKLVAAAGSVAVVALVSQAFDLGLTPLRGFLTSGPTKTGLVLSL